MSYWAMSFNANAKDVGRNDSATGLGLANVCVGLLAADAREWKEYGTESLEQVAMARYHLVKYQGFR